MRLRRLAVFLAMLPLGGCVQEFAVTYATPDEFLDLCREHNGLEIYETAENVESVIYPYEDGCGRACKATLRDDRYKFVEADASGESLIGLTPRRGIYRFTLEKIGHPNCQRFEKWHATEYPQAAAEGRHISKYDGVCIATWSIDRLTARYEKRDLGITTRERWYGALNTGVERVVDRRDGSILAEFQHHWIETPNLPGGMQCPGYSGAWSLYSVLQPAERQ